MHHSDTTARLSTIGTRASQIIHAYLANKNTLAYGDTGEMGDGVYASLPWNLATLKNSLSQLGGYPVTASIIMDNEEKIAQNARRLGNKNNRPRSALGISRPKKCVNLKQSDSISKLPMLVKFPVTGDYPKLTAEAQRSPSCLIFFSAFSTSRR